MRKKDKIPIYLLSIGMVFAFTLNIFALFLITGSGDMFFALSLILFSIVVGFILVISAFIFKYAIEISNTRRHNNHNQFKLKPYEKAWLLVVFLFITLFSVIVFLPIDGAEKIVGVIVALIFSIIIGYDIGLKIFKERRINV